jgi:hypothetical protein
MEDTMLYSALASIPAAFHRSALLKAAVANAALVLALQTPVLPLLPALPAAAQDSASPCPIPEEGIWLTQNAKRKQLTQIEVKSRCDGQQLTIRARAYTSCIPRDCKWGWTEAFYRADGSLRVELKGFYGMRVIDMRIFGGQRMEATVMADPHDPEVVETITTHMLTRQR